VPRVHSARRGCTLVAMRRAGLFVSDADRDAAAAALGDHVAEGRVTLEEFRDRLDQVYAARTAAELDRAMVGLSARHGSSALDERRVRMAARYRRGWVRFARVNAVVWALWLAVSLVAAHAVLLFPLVLTLPWAVARLAWAPRFRQPSRA
jgi:Domain of unknown function (DUF1707)